MTAKQLEGSRKLAKLRESIKMAKMLEKAWAARFEATTDEACESAEAYLRMIELNPEDWTQAELAMMRAQWFVLWALVQSRKDMESGEDAG